MNPTTFNARLIRHEFTPGKFAPDTCQVMLARGRCFYRRDEHPSTLAPCSHEATVTEMKAVRWAEVEWEPDYDGPATVLRTVCVACHAVSEGVQS